MKKLFSTLAAIAAMISFSSCEGMMDMVTTVPVFSVSEVVYNGQSQKLVRLSTCAYEWKTNHPECCNISVDPNDSTAMAHFYLDRGTKACKMIITATNKLHPEYTSEHEVSVRKWSWEVYDSKGNKVTSLAPGQTFTIKLFDSLDNTPIERIYRDIDIKNGYKYEDVSIKFLSGIHQDEETDFGLTATSENTEYTFSIPASFADDQVDFVITVGTASTKQSYLL